MGILRLTSLSFLLKSYWGCSIIWALEICVAVVKCATPGQSWPRLALYGGTSTQCAGPEVGEWWQSFPQRSNCVLYEIRCFNCGVLWVQVIIIVAHLGIWTKSQMMVGWRVARMRFEPTRNGTRMLMLMSQVRIVFLEAYTSFSNKIYFGVYTYHLYFLITCSM